MYTIMQPDFIHEDERGSLVQLLHDGWRQVNVIFSKGNTVRGGHYHKQNREAFYIISGSCEVTLSLGGEEQTRIFKSGDYFAIEKNTGHSFKYLEDTLLIGLYDIGVEDTPGGYSTFSRCLNIAKQSSLTEGRHAVC